MIGRLSLVGIALVVGCGSGGTRPVVQMTFGIGSSASPTQPSTADPTSPMQASTTPDTGVWTACADIEDDLIPNAIIPTGQGDPRLVAAFRATAADVSFWAEMRDLPRARGLSSRWRDLPSSTLLDVCYFDGDFGEPRGPVNPEDPNAPHWTRVVSIIAPDGEPVLDGIGPDGSIDIVDPADYASPAPSPMPTQSS